MHESACAPAGDCAIEDLISVCISRQIFDGEMVAQGMATPLVAAGYMLAKLTHAPRISFASAVGGSLCLDGAALSLGRAEDVWLGLARNMPHFSDVVCGVIPSMHPKEFFRPAQVDPAGNTNNVAFGDFRSPRFRLPGSAGIADLTAFSPGVYLYVPRHGRATFVRKLDFVSGVGVLGVAERECQGVSGPGPRFLVSDLGCFDFAGGRMRLLSNHPGVSVARVQAKTGFELAIAGDLHTTAPPTQRELDLLRRVVDPLGIRSLEVLGGIERWAKLRAIAAAEGSRSVFPSPTTPSFASD